MKSQETLPIDPSAELGVALHAVVGHERTEMEQIDDAIQRIRKAVAECNEREYEKAQADLLKIKPSARPAMPNNQAYRPRQ